MKVTTASIRDLILLSLDEILDIVSLRLDPCFVTCSADRSIKMFHLWNKSLIHEFELPHEGINAENIFLN